MNLKYLKRIICKKWIYLAVAVGVAVEAGGGGGGAPGSAAASIELFIRKAIESAVLLALDIILAFSSAGGPQELITKAKISELYKMILFIFFLQR